MLIFFRAEPRPVGDFALRLIPTRLNFDFCPFTFSDGTDEIGPIGDGVPGVTASVEDGLIGFPDLITEGVAA